MYICYWHFSSSMYSSQQDSTPLSAPGSTQASSIPVSIPQSSYLTVPYTKPLGHNLSLPGPAAFEGNHSGLRVPSSKEVTTSASILEPSEPPRIESTSNRHSPSLSERDFASYPESFYMSVYSSTSTTSEHSTFSNPPARIYRVPSFQKMSGSRKISVVCFFASLGRFTKINLC